MAAISRYMELTIEPVQQASGCELPLGAQRLGGSHGRLLGEVTL